MARINKRSHTDWVSSFLTVHQHIMGYSASCRWMMVKSCMN